MGLIGSNRIKLFFTMEFSQQLIDRQLVADQPSTRVGPGAD